MSFGKHFEAIDTLINTVYVNIGVRYQHSFAEEVLTPACVVTHPGVFELGHHWFS